MWEPANIKNRFNDFFAQKRKPFQPQKCVSDASVYWIHLLFARVGAVLKAPAQSSLLVTVVAEPPKPYFLPAGPAQGPANIGVFVRRRALDSLQRAGALAGFLSAAPFAPAAPARGVAAPGDRGFSTRRSAPGFDLRAGRRPQAREQNANPPIQRRLSLSVGTGALSRSVELAPLLAAALAAPDPATGPAARSLARGWVTIPRRRDAVRIIRGCVSRRMGRSSGTARCVRATPAPTPA